MDCHCLVLDLRKASVARSSPTDGRMVTTRLATDIGCLHYSPFKYSQREDVNSGTWDLSGVFPGFYPVVYADTVACHTSACRRRRAT
jgi:hypothetical protein